MIRLMLVTLHLAPPELPQKFIHWWDESYTDGLAEARTRNVPVLLAFIQDNEEANDRIVAGLYQDPGFIKLTEKCVPMVASIGQHETRTQPVRGQTRSTCSRFGAISCARHRNTDTQARKKFWPDVVKTPSHIVITPDGKEFGRIIDVADAGTYAGMVAKAQQKLGRGLSASLYREVLQDLKAIDHSLEKEEFTAAVESLRKVEKTCRKHPLERRIRSYWAQINSAGGMILARAQELEKKKNHVEALRLLRDGSTSFQGAKVQSALRKAANRLRRTKDGRLAQKILEREDRSRPEFEKARKAEQEGDYVKAASHYRKVVARARETPLASRAEARLAALKKDPDIGKLIIADENASVALKAYRSAMKLLKRGKTEAGKKALREVIQKWPRTPAARKARSALEDSD